MNQMNLYCMIQVNTKGQYIVNSVLASILIASFLIIFFLTVCLFVILLKKKKGIKELRNHRSDLEKQKLELENQLSNSQKEYNDLTERYEELKKEQIHIMKLAYSDDLTELPNRVSFTEMLVNVLDTLRQEETIAIMDIDIDDFKVVNDTIGHSYGDELLLDVTHRLKQVLDENDYIARIGGDEFRILTQNISDISEYEDKIKRIMKVFSYPFVLSTMEFFVTVSIGVVFAPRDGNTPQALVKNVDTAMYVAKANGKNTYCYFDESMNVNLMRKIEMQSELRKAIEHREFQVYYQPQINLMSGKLEGFEALVRWKHADGTMVMPGDFIPLAEETGLIVPIGQHVMIEACRVVKFWNDKGYKDLSMAINLSERQFHDRNFVQMVIDIIEEVQVNPKNIEFEITESLALDDIDNTINTIKKLQEIGVKFSLDDFGTGYSSMNYLKQLPVDVLKIDKSFLDTIIEDVSGQKIVQTIIAMAQILELEVVAEGVEYPEQEKYLKDMKCNKAQGYLYSRPIPEQEAYEMVKKFYNHPIFDLEEVE